MEIIVIAAQIILALGIYNVWLLRAKKETPYRGGAATDLRSEFAAYGLPASFMLTVGAAKLICATCLIAGIWYPPLVVPAAAGLAILIFGAVAMHFKVRDPLQRAAPATVMLGLSTFVAIAAYTGG